LLHHVEVIIGIVVVVIIPKHLLLDLPSIVTKRKKIRLVEGEQRLLKRASFFFCASNMKRE
jgi:hypothetical protein